VYNGSPYTGSGTCSDGLTPVVTYTPGPDAPLNSGESSFTVTCSGTNYGTATATATIAIAPAPVTATAGSGSTTYDGVTHAPLPCVVTGGYTGDLSCTNSPASVGPAANTYAIGRTVTGTGLANFAITSVDGSYAITPKLAGATATPVTGVYNGSAYSGNAACSDGLAPVFTYAGGAAPVNAGTTGFTVTCSGSNYITATATATIAIAKATPVFSGLSGPTINAGATPTGLSGTLKAGTLIPPGSVSITLNGVTQSAAITSETGAFSSSFATGALTPANSPYTIIYSYAGDTNFTAADASRSLTASYTFVGLKNAPPPTGTKFNSGSAITLEWQFKSGSTAVDSSQVPHVVTLSGGGMALTFNSDAGGSGFRYSSSSKSWQFNLQTKSSSGQKFPAGVYAITIAPQRAGYPSKAFQIELK
jgi:hypothetical protein